MQALSCQCLKKPLVVLRATSSRHYVLIDRALSCPSSRTLDLALICFTRGDWGWRAASFTARYHNESDYDTTSMVTNSLTHLWWMFVFFLSIASTSIGGLPYILSCRGVQAVAESFSRHAHAVLCTAAGTRSTPVHRWTFLVSRPAHLHSCKVISFELSSLLFSANNSWQCPAWDTLPSKLRNSLIIVDCPELRESATYKLKRLEPPVSTVDLYQG